MLQNEAHKPEAEPHARLRKLLKLLWILVAVAAFYSGWVFYSRWQTDRASEQRALEKERAQDERTVELLGGNRFEILHFYAMPGAIRRGDSTQLCYGVSNAKTVRIEPATSRVWPSFSRCFDVRPAKDTTYTLTIEDGQGHSKTAAVTVRVVR